MKIGILGGTFNPPHKGHLILAKEAREKLRLDKILFIPANIPPHKQAYPISAQHRLNMLKLAIGEDKFFEISDIEIKRGDKSYTIDTVRKLKKSFPNSDFYLIIGSDLANDFSSWKDYQAIEKLVKIVVGAREAFPLRGRDSFIILDITQIDICSSKIRENIRQGKSIKQLVNNRVASYIEKHKLYQFLRTNC